MSKHTRGQIRHRVFTTIDDLASAYFLLQKTANVDGFVNWIRNYHQIGDTNELLPGYKFLIDSAFKHFLEEIYESKALDLSEDEVLSRAHFKGIPLSETPNSCEKTILLKRIWTHGKTVSKANTWQDVQQAMMKMKTDLSALTRIFQGYSRTKAHVSKQRVLRTLACGQLLNFFTDTSHNIPRAQLVFPSIEETATEQYLSSAYAGYVYGLQYLWFIVIGRNDFERTIVKRLHTVTDRNAIDDLAERKDILEGVFRNEEKSVVFVDVTKLGDARLDDTDLDEEERDFVEGVRRLMPPHSKRWAALDRFYESIKEEIVRPRQERLQIIPGMSQLMYLEGYTNFLLKDLLDPKGVIEPEYLTRTDRDSCKRLLARLLLWYDVSVFDTQRVLVFNGAPAFASTLLGTVELFRAHHSHAPVKAVIFKHPTDGENRFDYSFGVFMPVYGSLGISDNSGWLIFFDCQNDYAGLGQSPLGFVGAVARLGRKRGPISLQEIVVDRELFKEYLREHSVSSVFDTLIKETPVGTKEIGSLTDIVQQLHDFVGLVKGKNFEYVVHKWICESRRFHDTTCDTWINGEQIDCTGKMADSLSFFECKLSVHQDTIKNTLDQISRKSMELSKTTRDVKAWLIVYDRVSALTKENFVTNGIFVLDNFRAVIQEDKCFVGSREATLQLLDWQFRFPGKFRPEY